MAKRHHMNERQYNEHSHLLWEIEVGQPVQIQNQTEPYPRRWEKTGRVVEALDNRQYHVCVDGSNRVTRHNRRFFRKINPVIDRPYYPQPEGPSKTLETAEALTILRLQHTESQPRHCQPEVSDLYVTPMEVEEVESHEDGDNVTVMDVDEGQNQPPSNQASH